MRNLLLLSSSKVGSGDYLEQATPQIGQFLGKGIESALFIPFAGVTIDYDDYTAKVSQAFASLDVKIESIHQQSDPEQAIKKASAIVVGGGNTFHLLHQLYQFDLVGIIREQVMSGTPYIGWSAGSNIAAPTIKTTNDMPIIQPPSFHALHLVPFQINPHFLDHHPENFNGETRAERLQEFMRVNPESKTIGLPEGTAIELKEDKVSLVGDAPIYLFQNNTQTVIDVNNLPADLLDED